jgi:glycosyltransferase involved in cell wall biosynthesis
MNVAPLASPSRCVDGAAIPAELRTALVHYWLVNRRGGEAVLEAIGRLAPNAHLYAHVVDRSVLFGSLEAMPLTTTFISRLPASRRFYQAYLGLMPTALEALDMSAYDLIVSSEAGPAKWVLPAPGAKHICYCHSPMRYVWDQRFTYFDRLPPVVRPLAHFAAHRLRQSDVLSSVRVSQFVANSTFVAKRIEQFYRRDAEVIHPPVDVEDFTTAEPEDFYLCAGEIRHYKRLDLAVQACGRLGRRLVVAGAGDQAALKALGGRHVQFTGKLGLNEMRSLMRRCRALLFPGVEDFGIVPVEVMASGRPVIAYGHGGVLDSVEPGISGLFFERQTVDDLCAAITQFERNEGLFSPERSQACARRFSRGVFETNFSGLVRRVCLE